MDPRWSVFVQDHPYSSVFHTVEWLKALRSTYGYSPTVITTSPSGTALTNGIVVGDVNSWLTGRRLVSLPFSDHCQPLVTDPEDLMALLKELYARASGKTSYTEVRPRSIELASDSSFRPYSHWYLHMLDLRPSIEELYSRLHRDSCQRKIRKADRENVVLDQGRSESSLNDFYKLLLLTRRRHKLVPQPLQWFRNLVQCFGSKLTIRVARVEGRPIASILTLQHKQTVVYKYGCSDAHYHNLGAVPRLFWQAIQEAKSEGIEEFDLGRSEQSNAGLIRFKEHLGAERIPLTYWRACRKDVKSWKGVIDSSVAQRFIATLPDSWLRIAGNILYRHAG